MFLYFEPWVGLLIFMVSENFAFSFVSLELDDEVQLCVFTNECHSSFVTLGQMKTMSIKHSFQE